ncbi:DUF5994 family protein [Mycolicibacterium mengxianglii]|uniref:DUF5994 family protein n=1 Tax=Mycolicibacterium mengxianglii TaxID=2736649 RepID=UPI0018D01E4B|nr:DUF5994 family protein [Mycolicibacterium mengxianglii]
MNGLSGSRRLARPVRLALAPTPGTGIDGAWWPHTASVASELPELIGVLHAQLGVVVDISINWSATEGPLDLNAISPSGKTLGGTLQRSPRLMVVTGQEASATLLVVPHMTSQGLGTVVMRRAAGVTVEHSQRDAKLYELADCVMRAAAIAKWSESKQSPAAPAVAVMPGV